MSSYLNSKKASLLYKDEALATYFVDKTAMLDELIPVIEQTALTNTALNTAVPLKGKSNKYPPLWQVHDSQYDRSLPGKRQEHTAGL